MASSPKRGRSFYSGDVQDSYGIDDDIPRKRRKKVIVKTATQLQLNHSSTAVTSQNSTPSSPVSPPPKAGPLTKQEMEEKRQRGGDDSILANQSRKTNDGVKRVNEEMICDFETIAKEWPNELRMKPIVFANTDFAISFVGKSGCRLGFSDGSAYLDIPAEALAGDQIIYMYKLPGHTDVTGPADQRKIYSYSGLITCGPEGTHFNKDVTLNFEHCAAVDDSKSSLRLAVLGRKNETTPWITQEQTEFSVKGNRVEHHLCEFSQRCYGLEEDDAADAPRLRMCQMLAVSRDRRLHVEAVLMRDEISLINAHRDNFIARGFEPNEVHVIRGVNIEPTEQVSFEGTSGFSENGPNDWNIRGFYSFIMPTARIGRVGLSLRQPGSETPIAAISITEQGDVEIDNAEANLQVDGLSFPYVHNPTQVEDSGIRQILPEECPHFAQSFVETYNLQMFDGNAPSTEREQIPNILLTAEEAAQNPTEPADENVSPDEERIAEAVDRAVPTSGADERAPSHIAALDRPGSQCGQVGRGMSDDHEDPQSSNLEITSTTEESFAAMPGQDRVARRRQISTSSLRSDDGEILDAADGEIREHSAAVSGGDNESPTTSLRRGGSSSSKRNDGNEPGQC